MSRKIFSEIIRTISLSVFAAFLVVLLLLGIAEYQVNEMQYNNKNLPNEDVDPKVLENLITENIALEKQAPDNFIYNLKIGYLYELKKDNQMAEFEYKAALDKAPYFEHRPQYYLALLYIKQNKLQAAQQIMDNIGEKPDKKLIRYKAKVYAQLGDHYYDMGDYLDSSLKYEKAINYYKIIHSKKYKLLNDNLASAYVYLADENVNSGNLEDAISYLLQAKAIINSPIIKYKLALLLMDSQPYVAAQYFEQVYKEEPAIINYDTYSRFLLKLYAMAQMLDKPVDAELYKYKIDSLKKYYDNNILSIDDLNINYLNGKITVDNWRLRYLVNVQLKFKNVSKHDISSLYLHVEFKDRDTILETYDQQVICKDNTLKINQMSPLISIQVPTRKVKFNDDTKEITVDIYASKGEKSYKLLLKELKIKERIKPQKNWIKEVLQKLGFELL